MKNFNRIKITHKLSENISLDYVYLLPEDTGVSAQEMANTLLAITKDVLAPAIETSIKIDTKSYKRIPSKYLVLGKSIVE
jgi:hypothetical protein